MSGRTTEIVRTASAPHQRARAWLQAHPCVVDTCVAVVWFALFNALLAGSDYSSDLPTILAGLGTALLLCTRRRFPQVSFVGVLLASLVLAPADPVGALLAVALVVYTFGAGMNPALAWGGLALAVASLACSAAIATSTERSGREAVDPVILAGVAVLVVALVVGFFVRGHRMYVTALVEHAGYLEREQKQRAQLVAMEERERIAREVHDVVAHALTIVVRRTDGALVVLQSDPDLASRTLEQLRGVAGASLSDIRFALDRGGCDAVHRRTLEAIPVLVRSYQVAGLPVELTMEASGSPLPPSLELTVYRVLQESLTNALRHAHRPQLVTVRLSRTRGVTLAVENDGAHPGAAPTEGRGLSGMRTRASMHGGHLEAGFIDAGLYRVVLQLPDGRS